ncbi:unnamed protein product [Lampetra planeri]
MYRDDGGVSSDPATSFIPDGGPRDQSRLFAASGASGPYGIPDPYMLRGAAADRRGRLEGRVRREEERVQGEE